VSLYIQPVPEVGRNGIIIGYEVHDESGLTLVTVNGSDLFHARLVLSSIVDHSLSLTAFTDVGRSPPATVRIRARAQQRQLLSNDKVFFLAKFGRTHRSKTGNKDGDCQN